MAVCKSCGRSVSCSELAWIDEDECEGLCVECAGRVFLEFIKERGLFEELAKHIEKRYGIKNGKFVEFAWL